MFPAGAACRRWKVAGNRAIANSGELLSAIDDEAGARNGDPEDEQSGRHQRRHEKPHRDRTQRRSARGVLWADDGAGGSLNPSSVIPRPDEPVEERLKVAARDQDDMPPARIELAHAV